MKLLKRLTALVLLLVLVGCNANNSEFKRELKTFSDTLSTKHWQEIVRYSKHRDSLATSTVDNWDIGNVRSGFSDDRKEYCVGKVSFDIVQGTSIKKCDTHIIGYKRKNSTEWFFVPVFGNIKVLRKLHSELIKHYRLKEEKLKKVI